MDRVLELAVRAYMENDRGNPIVASKLRGLDNVDIRMTVFREQSETLEAAYEKALAESKLRHWLD